MQKRGSNSKIRSRSGLLWTIRTSYIELRWRYSKNHLSDKNDSEDNRDLRAEMLSNYGELKKDLLEEIVRIDADISKASKPAP